MRVLIWIFFIGLITIFATPRESRATEPATEGTLRSFFAGHGFGGGPLQRRFGNHLFLVTSINGRRTALMIDTGAPNTLINRDSVGSLGLSVQKTNARVGRVFGWTYETLGASKLKSMATGNCVLTNVPVGIADGAELNNLTRLPHLDGLFGAREMVKFGAVIDCARQMIYLNPKGPSPVVSQQLAAILAERGFTRIPMRLTSSHHFEVESAVNGHPARLVVDTGAGTTLISKPFAIKAGVTPVPLAMADAGDGRREHISDGSARELAIGDFKINNAEIALADVANYFDGGLLGEEHLSFNFAVIDLGGLNLYLRHADAH